MRGKKRPLTERAHAVGIAVVAGASEAARVTGIPERTILRWESLPEMAELGERNKDVVSAEWWAGAQFAFRRALDLLGKTDDPVKAATTGAIIFDKMALTRGEATTRSETKDITHDLDNETRQKVTAWLDRRMDADAGTTDGVPAGAGTEVREPAAV